MGLSLLLVVTLLVGPAAAEERAWRLGVLTEAEQRARCPR
jgi:hypothetical protein